MEFGTKLRQLLLEKKLTQKEFANILNIAPSTIGNYIQNSREPDFETLITIANFFDVSVDYLIGNRLCNTASPLEDELLQIFRKLSPEEQKIYLNQGKAFIET